MTIIGDKNTFAVEYEVQMLEPVKMAYSRIWIQGQYFGDIEDTGHLFGIYNCLDNIIIKRELLVEPEFDNKSPYEILRLTFPHVLQKENLDTLWDDSKSFDKHAFQFGENYDNYLVSIFAVDKITHFVWQFWSGPDMIASNDLVAKRGAANFQDIIFVHDQLQKEFVIK